MRKKNTICVDVMILQSSVISLAKTRISAYEIVAIHSLNLSRKRADVGFSLLSVYICFPVSLSVSLSFYLSGKRRHGDVLVGGEAVSEGQ